MLVGELRTWGLMINRTGPAAQKTARLAKTERSRQATTSKAMATLRIGVPTPSSIYSELMIEAGRPIAKMGVSAQFARSVDEGTAPPPRQLSKFCLWFGREFAVYWTRGDGLFRSSRHELPLALFDANESTVVLKSDVALVRLLPGSCETSTDGGISWKVLCFLCLLPFYLEWIKLTLGNLVLDHWQG